MSDAGSIGILHTQTQWHPADGARLHAHLTGSTAAPRQGRDALPGHHLAFELIAFGVNDYAARRTKAGVGDAEIELRPHILVQRAIRHVDAQDRLLPAARGFTLTDL